MAPGRSDHGGWAMGCKVAFVIVSLAGIAATLLTIRQMRTQAAHEFATLRLRVMRVDEASARLRADIARHVAPETLRQRLEELEARSSDDAGQRADPLSAGSTVEPTGAQGPNRPGRGDGPVRIRRRGSVMAGADGARRSAEGMPPMTGRARWVARALASGCTLALVLIVLRVGLLQARVDPKVQEVLQARQRAHTISVPRADVLDRRGRPLVVSRYVHRVFFDPLVVEQEIEQGRISVEELAWALAWMTGESEVDIARRIRSCWARTASAGRPRPSLRPRPARALVVATWPAGRRGAPHGDGQAEPVGRPEGVQALAAQEPDDPTDDPTDGSTGDPSGDSSGESSAKPLIRYVRCGWVPGRCAAGDRSRASLAGDLPGARGGARSGRRGVGGVDRGQGRQRAAVQRRDRGDDGRALDGAFGHDHVHARCAGPGVVGVAWGGRGARAGARRCTCRWTLRCSGSRWPSCLEPWRRPMRRAGW
ncbi:MAG: hypothetical protein KatS3mg103_1353 [Phycisphaerales bacterium]|nr:MAG: hypothetical protein KatS3mg103_1353 [Phycisphaerales bacterium]